MKRQWRKAYVSGLRRYWRTRKEKTKGKYGVSHFLSKLWNDVHTASQILSWGDLTYGGKRKGGSGCFTSMRSPAELQITRGCSLARGILVQCSSCSPLPTFYQSDSTLGGKKRWPEGKKTIYALKYSRRTIPTLRERSHLCPHRLPHLALQWMRRSDPEPWADAGKLTFFHLFH